MEPMTFDDVSDVLELNIKEDVVTKKILFASGLLTYTDNDQINIAMEGVSSVGKTYIALEVFSLFPDLQIYTGMSPTAFYHAGTPSENVPNTKIHDWERKIILFIDQPDSRILQKMRPLLSHDQKYLKWCITDRKLKVLTCIVKGFGTIVHCATPMFTDPQERTRLLYVSPSEDAIKIDKALELQAMKATDYELIGQLIEQNPERRELQARIRTIRDAHIRHINIPDAKLALRWFKQKNPHPLVRHLRDFPRLLSLIKASALLNCRLRKEEKNGVIVATEEDVKEGIKLFEPISECNALGLSPHLYEIWRIILEPLLKENEEVTYTEFQRAYYKHYHKPLQYHVMKNVYLQSFQSAGLIIIDRSAEDKRFFVIKSPEEASGAPQKNVYRRFGEE